MSWTRAVFGGEDEPIGGADAPSKRQPTFFELLGGGGGEPDAVDPQAEYAAKLTDLRVRELELERQRDELAARFAELEEREAALEERVRRLIELDPEVLAERLRKELAEREAQFAYRLGLIAQREKELLAHERQVIAAHEDFAEFTRRMLVRQD